MLFESIYKECYLVINKGTDILFRVAVLNLKYASMRSIKGMPFCLRDQQKKKVENHCILNLFHLK